MSLVTVREAAERLGVNASRVRAMIAAGQLVGQRVGSQWTLDLDSLERRERLHQTGARQRPLSTRSAWGAAALLDDHSAGWLSASERTRLRSRLRNASVEDTGTFVRWMAARHCVVRRYQVAQKELGEVLREEGVVASGVTAAAALRLGLGSAGQVEGEAYCREATHLRLVHDYLLVASGQGNLLVHEVADQNVKIAGSSSRTAWRLVVAVDLLERADAGSRATGADLLREVLKQFQAVPSRAERTGHGE